MADKKPAGTLKHPTVSIIIVTVNTPRMTAACIDSVRRHTKVPHELIVVNNSRARAIRECLKKIPEIQTIQNTKNLGYTKAVNQGVSRSRGKFLCFLNSDTWVPPQWAERLLKAARLPGVGAVSPLGEWEQYRPLRPEAALLTDHALQKWNTGHETRDVRWLSGFCLMTPRTAFIRLGLFDERFFFGWEDVDYSFRLRFRGYRLLKLQSLFIYHKCGASSSRRRHRQLVKQAEKLFLSKWNSLLNTRFRGTLALFAEADRRARLITR